jgi:hypothetical protein
MNCGDVQSLEVSQETFAQWNQLYSFHWFIAILFEDFTVQ